MYNEVKELSESIFKKYFPKSINGIAVSYDIYFNTHNYKMFVELKTAAPVYWIYKKCYDFSMNYCSEMHIILKVVEMTLEKDMPQFLKLTCSAVIDGRKKVNQ